MQQHQEETLEWVDYAGVSFDLDESLDDTAQGMRGTRDESPVGTGEIDAIGHAAGLVSRDDKPFRGIDEVERRDDHRWELDPRSAEDDLDQSSVELLA